MRTKDGNQGKTTASATQNARTKAKKIKKTAPPIPSVSTKKQNKKSVFPSGKQLLIEMRDGAETLNKEIDKVPGVKQMKKALRKKK